MRIGPKSELMTGGLRTSPALRDSHTGAGILGSTCGPSVASQHAPEGLSCSLDDHSNLGPASRRFKNDRLIDYDQR